MDDEVRVYGEHTLWLLGQFSQNLDECDATLLAARPPAALEGNNLLAIAKHANAVTRAYALGIGCGLPTARTRESEFVAELAEAQAILTDLQATTRDVSAAFERLGREALEARLVPEQSVYGMGNPREMSAREAIVENIRHLGIHLGELRLTRSMLEQGNARAD